MSSEWRTVAFKELCDITRGASPRPIQDYLGVEGMPWIKIADATAEPSRFISRTKEKIKQHGVRASVEVFPGDLILSNSATPGLPKFLKIQACIHDGWMLLRNFRNLDKDFAYWLLLSERLKLVAQGNGSVFTNLKTEILKSHVVTVPPVGIQRKIADSLNCIDDRITLLRETNTTLEGIAQALFKSWFVDFDPVQAKMQGLAPEGMDEATAALFPDSFEESELGAVPKGWKVKSLDAVASFLNGLALQKFPPTGDNDLPVIKIAQLRKGETVGADLASRSIKPEYVIQNGDVLFSWSGSLEVEIWCGGEGALNQHLFKVTSDVFPKWFYFLWTRHHLEHFRQVAASKATTMGHIQRAHLTGAKVLVPGAEVLHAANSVLEPILNRLIENSLQAFNLAALRDNLLPRLISGQLQLPEVGQLEESLA
jgi:type I restriction enzyme S subunit